MEAAMAAASVDDVTRLGRLQNTHESVAKLQAWVESGSSEAVCYFAWDDQDSIKSKMVKAPHYQVKRHSTGFALYKCDDDRGSNAKQIVGNAKEIIGKPTMDPKKRKK